MEIRRVNQYTYDVFQGTQWDAHTRVRRGKHNTYVVSGEKLTHAALKWLHQILAPNMPINYAQPHEVTLNNCAILAGMGK